MKKLGLACVIALGLSGCGGGSGGDSTIIVDPAELELVIDGDMSVTTGDSVALVVTEYSGLSLSDIAWTTTSDAIQILAPHTMAIGFDAPAAGDYPISVSAKVNGTRLTQDFTLSVTEGEAPQAIVRLAQEASEGGRVSLRVDAIVSDTKKISSITWKQLSGPLAQDVRYDDGAYSQNIYFQAPAVSKDTVMQYQASVNFSDGTSAADTVYVVVKNVDFDKDAYFVNANSNTSVLATVSDHMIPYHADSPYANALKNCVYNNTITDTCNFNTLPLIGSVTESPTIDDILDRTYVSHPWMGDAFKAFLENSDASADTLKMLRATTAIVISYDVRPSFYWVATGAIYLDANNLWRTPQERDTLNTAPDYRSGFGNELDYITTWRYVKDGANYYPQPGLSMAARNSRSLSGVDAALTWLLYHELAHANDFFNYATWSGLQSTDNPLSYFNRNNPRSDGLTNALPLTSAQLHALADVVYGGDTATTTQKNYSAQQVADWFETDGAVSFYSYYTSREDYANLVERFMMLYRLGVSSDVGVFSRATFDSRDYLLTWGQRNRINDPHVQQRADYAVSRVFPDLDVPAAQAAMPAPQTLPVGQGWFDVLTVDNQQESVSSYSAAPESDVKVSLPDVIVPQQFEVHRALPGQ